LRHSRATRRASVAIPLPSVTLRMAAIVWGRYSAAGAGDFPDEPAREGALFSAVKLARKLNASINTEEGQLRCRLEQVEGEIELLSDEKIALIEAIARRRALAVLSKP
jgi:hypothetical protein